MLWEFRVGSKETEAIKTSNHHKSPCPKLSKLAPYSIHTAFPISDDDTPYFQLF